MGEDCRFFRILLMNYLEILVVYLILNLISTSLVSSTTQNPLVYTKLKYDNDYLQVYRNFQKEWPHQDRENVKKVSLFEPSEHDKSREIEYIYYENDKVDNSSITHDDLIVEAFDRVYKSRLIPVYIYSYDNDEDKRRSSDKRLTSLSRCRRDLTYLLENLPSLNRSEPISPELDAFYDSFASAEPGILFGNFHWTGLWRQCYKRQIFDLDRSTASNTIAFRGRYCVASIKSSKWDENIRRKTNKLLKDGNYFKYPNQQYDYARFFRIQVGFCMPDSCESSTIDWARDEVKELALHRLQEPYKSYDLADVYCIPDETSKLRKIEPSGRLFIAASMVWFSLILLATYLESRSRSMQKRGADLKNSKTKTSLILKDEKQSNSNLTKFTSAMCLQRNWERLIETESLFPVKKLPSIQPVSYQYVMLEEKPKQLKVNDLLFLNAFKVIGSIIILFGHVSMFNEQLGKYPLNYDSLENEFLFHFFLSAVFLVDWFFVITGFITTYGLFVSKKVENNSTIQWFYSFFHRYVRLAPLYVLLFWYAQSVFQYTGSGPIWDYGTTNMTVRSICKRESWIWPITLTSNFFTLHEECIMPAWYISNDFQFFLVTPPLLILLKNSPAYGWLMGLLLIGITNLLRVHRYWTDPRAQHLDLLRPRYDAYARNNWDIHPTYLQPQYRFGSYLIGVLTAHYAYMVLSGKWRSFLYPEGAFAITVQANEANKLAAGRRTPSNTSDCGGIASLKIRILRLVLFIIGASIVLSMSVATWVVKSLIPDALEPNARLIVTIVYGIDHSYTSIGISLMFLMLMFGAFQSLRRFLTHPIWSVLSRLSFIIFLIQIEVIYWFDMGTDGVIDMNASEVFRRSLCVLCACIILAVILTLTIELPLTHLEREFIGIHFSGKSSSKSKQSTTPKDSSSVGEASKSLSNQKLHAHQI